jgi:hypothetical protein
LGMLLFADFKGDRELLSLLSSRCLTSFSRFYLSLLEVGLDFQMP